MDTLPSLNSLNGNPEPSPRRARKSNRKEKRNKAEHYILLVVLVQTRVDREFTQADLARKLNREPAWVNAVERGSTVPDILEFREWCVALDTTPEEVFKDMFQRLLHYQHTGVRPEWPGREVITVQRVVHKKAPTVFDSL